MSLLIEMLSATVVICREEGGRGRSRVAAALVAGAAVGAGGHDHAGVAGHRRHDAAGAHRAAAGAPRHGVRLHGGG